MSDPQAAPLLSVIIPCWNDPHALRGILGSLRELEGVCETIVADASNDDTCADLTLAHGAKLVRCNRPSRGLQMNAGAQAASGRMLLFQHADTELTQSLVDSVRGASEDDRVVGGAFHRKFDDRHANLRWLESVARVWARIGGSFYGDQSIFVRRSVFEALDGFAEIPLMEDLDMCRRLRKRGRTVLLDPPIASSPRHAKRYGSWRTSIRNASLISLFHLGVSPEVLHRWYYRLPRTHPGSQTCSPAVPEFPAP